MACELASGGGMHHDTAFVEAVNSARCFMSLTDLGVPFPTDGAGRYIGFQTDHDTYARGTSAGPLTSKYMTEALERRAREATDISIIDNTTVVRVVTDNGRAVGAVCLSSSENEKAELFAVGADDVVLATGGAAGVYSDSVYPPSQSGALGLAIDAGCKMNNLTEWQYGIASKKVRWNLSGSYQQVVPDYYSTDKSGRRYDFLSEYFSSEEEVCNAIFLKGYQWPFDSAKADGSSRIDLAVSAETAAGRSVWMDFRENRRGFALDKLCDEARTYLCRSGAVGATPARRLVQMNPQAAEFYKQHGIDIFKEPIQIAVCAQHMNGGADVDINWQTSVKHLFAVGETAGTFGMYRPGGSALNSTQVGALRAAEYIATHFEPSENREDILRETVAAEKEFVNRCFETQGVPQTDFSHEMSRCAAHCRVYEELETLCGEISRQADKKHYTLESLSYGNVRKLYKYKDNLTAQYALCRTFLQTLPQIGSRGGAVFYKNGKIVAENTAFREKAIVTNGENVTFESLRKAPDTAYNFESVWRQYRERHGLDII